MITFRNWFHLFQLWKHLRATQLMQSSFFDMSAAKHVKIEKDSEKVFSVIYPQNIGWTACIGHIFFWVNFSEILKHEVQFISGEVQ